MMASNTLVSMMLLLYAFASASRVEIERYIVRAKTYDVPETKHHSSILQKEQKVLRLIKLFLKNFRQ